MIQGKTTTSSVGGTAGADVDRRDRRDANAGRNRLPCRQPSERADRRAGDLGGRMGTARFGKNLVRRPAVRAQCGYNQSDESQRRNWLIRLQLKRHINVSPVPRSPQTLRT